MDICKTISKHLSEVYFGKNWTWVNLSDTLSDLDLGQVTTKIEGFNTILALCFHIDYYVLAITSVLNEKPLESKDKFSFDHPKLETEDEWQGFKSQIFNNGSILIKLIAHFDDKDLGNDFFDPKYGSYYRNFQGLIEHTHYHLGQIVILNKLICVKQAKAL